MFGLQKSEFLFSGENFLALICVWHELYERTLSRLLCEVISCIHLLII